MKLLFWRWLHRKLEQWWHWVYYKKLAPVDSKYVVIQDPDTGYYYFALDEAPHKIGVSYETKSGFRTPPSTGEQG